MAKTEGSWGHGGRFHKSYSTKLWGHIWLRMLFVCPLKCQNENDFLNKPINAVNISDRCRTKNTYKLKQGKKKKQIVSTHNKAPILRSRFHNFSCKTVTFHEIETQTWFSCGNVQDCKENIKYEPSSASSDLRNKRKQWGSFIFNPKLPCLVSNKSWKVR